MKILAFDQATTKTGWALFVDGHLEQHGVINLTKEKLQTDERVVCMTTRMIGLIAACVPDYVVIEDVAMQRDASALTKLARIQGGIMTMCYGMCKCIILKPSVWRKELGFRQGRNVARQQLKKQAKEYVLGKFNVKTTEDEADAICIGCAAVNKYDGGQFYD